MFKQILIYLLILSVIFGIFSVAFYFILIYCIDNFNCDNQKWVDKTTKSISAIYLITAKPKLYLFWFIGFIYVNLSKFNFNAIIKPMQILQCVMS